MADFITDNASAIFALIGIALGAMLTFIGSWLLRRRELSLRLWEKLVDRRIEAHERVIEVVKSLRTVFLIEPFTIEGPNELARAPAAFFSREAFEACFSECTNAAALSSTWLSTDVKRELNLLQDYLTSLHASIGHCPSEVYPQIGNILRQDFIDFSASIEKLAFRFFENDLYSLKLHKLEEWHKYPIDETERRLRKTAFYERWGEVASICGTLPATPKGKLERNS